MKNISSSHSEIIELAWDDKVSFDSIYELTGLKEAHIIELMRSSMKPSSFRMWRKRVSGRKLKHSKKLNHMDSQYPETQIEEN